MSRPTMRLQPGTEIDRDRHPETRTSRDPWRPPCSGTPRRRRLRRSRAACASSCRRESCRRNPRDRQSPGPPGRLRASTARTIAARSPDCASAASKSASPRSVSRTWSVRMRLVCHSSSPTMTPAHTRYATTAARGRAECGGRNRAAEDISQGHRGSYSRPRARCATEACRNSCRSWP